MTAHTDVPTTASETGVPDARASDTGSPDARAVRRPIEPGGRMWDEIGLVTFSLTAGSAFLLQTMEPSIAAVVDEHSVFRTDAIGRAQRSLASVMTWVYGGQDALLEADRLREMHTTLNSVDDAGTRHTALSSGPWAWVLLTGVHSFVEGSKYFSSRPMSAEDAEAYYQENVQLMRNLFVLEKEIPPTYADFVRYFDDVVANQLVDSRTARDFLAGTKSVPPPQALPAVAHPIWRAVTFLPGRMQHFVTVGTTPPAARRKLGLEWSATDELALRALGRVVAHTVPLLPERLRYFPIAYEARRTERARRRLSEALERRAM
jgi:uncharacterized protein (DUF2236 family)